MAVEANGGPAWWVLAVCVTTWTLVQQIRIIRGDAEAEAWWYFEPTTTEGRVGAVLFRGAFVAFAIFGLVASL